MLADTHREAAEGIEQVIADIGDVTGKPYATRSVVELYWSAEFHRIAYGTQQKYGKHTENHTKLGKYLRDIGEPTVADWWDRLEGKRRGGMYGHQTTMPDLETTRNYWQDGKSWATS